MERVTTQNQWFSFGAFEKFLLKVFLFFFILWAIVTGHPDGIVMENPIYIIPWLLQLLLLSALFTGIMGIMQKRGLNRLGYYNLTDEILSTIQQKVVKSNLTPDHLIDLLNNSSIKLRKYQHFDNKISGKTGWTMKSWGERISITYVKEGNGKYVYSILSRPTIPFTIADYGKNLQNVDDIAELLTRQPAN